MTTRNKLALTSLSKIDLVDAGDNKGAMVTLLKRSTAPAASPSPAAPGPPETLLAKVREAVAKWWGDATEAKTFDQVLSQVSWEDVCDEIREWNYAVMESFCGTLRDVALTPEQKAATLTASLNQYAARVLAAIPVWTGGGTATPDPEPSKGDVVIGKSGRKMSAERLATLQAAHAHLTTALADLVPAGEAETPGATTDTPSQDDTVPDAPTTPAAPADGAAAPEVAKTAAPADVLKGITDPVVKAAFEAVQKQAEEATKRANETAELLEKREEEAAVAVLKARFAKGGDLAGVTATDEQIAGMRKMQAADPEGFEKSVITPMLALARQVDTAKLFGEIGSSGAGADDSGAYGQIEALAKAAREKDPTLTEAAAIAKVATENQALYKQYRAEQQGR